MIEGRRFAILLSALLLGGAVAGAQHEDLAKKQDAPPVPVPKPIVLPDLAVHGPPRPINGKKLGSPPADGAFSFIVGGHLYGHPAAEYPSPAKSFVTNIDRINATKPAFFVALGDTFKRQTEPYLKDTTEAAAKVAAPVFNAVGNHDLAAPNGRENYYRKWGTTYGAIDYGNSCLLFLDGEAHGWEIREKQLRYLFETVERVQKSKTIKNLFIFTHKVVWSVQEKYVVVFLHTNAHDKFGKITNYEIVIHPMLARLAKTKGVHWFAGDVGCPVRSYSIFHEVLDGVHYSACGIADLPTDTFMKVDVAADGTVALSAFPLQGQKAEPVTKYGVDFWMKHFHPKGLPPKIQSYLQHYRNVKSVLKAEWAKKEAEARKKLEK